MSSSPSTLSTSSSPSSSSKPKCRIAEILQYDCDEETDARGKPEFHCWPVPRIFRICPGRPAVEITRYVDSDASTGLVKLPPESSQQLPKGKPWRDIRTYQQNPVDDM